MEAQLETHVSKNRLEGSLGETPLEQLLGECHKHLLTGTITVKAHGNQGEIDLRVGFVDTASYGDLADDAAVDAMKGLQVGDYQLVQRLPDLDGVLGSAASFEGGTGDLPLVKLMRHCEDNALSCEITIVNEFDRGEIRYRAGEIVNVMLNGRRDDDSIVNMIRFEKARFRVTAPPLDLAISGWPTVGRASTSPFVLEDAALAPTASEAVEPTSAPAEPGTTETGRAAVWLDATVAVALAIGVGYLFYTLGLPWG